MRQKEFPRRSEKGQVLIIVMLMMIGLLGFTALAVDGGMIYVERRAAQTAADAGALAGGWKIAESLDTASPRVTYDNWSCSLSQVDFARAEGVDNAILQAGNNNYTIDDDITDNHGVATECYEEDLGTYMDRYVDLTTQVTSEVSTAFAHFVFGDNLVQTVTARVRVRPQTPLAFGYAVVALNDNGCNGNQNGAIFRGSADVDLDGGGVYSAGCLRGNGSNFTLDVLNGGITYVGGFSGNSSNMHPTPSNEDEVIPPSALSVPQPDCSSLPNQGQYNNGGGTLQPGVYTRIRITNGIHTMEPGLYCVTNSNSSFLVTGGELTGIGVTIYVANTGGRVRITGNADVVFEAPANSYYTPAIQGVLIYAESVSGESSDNYFQGNNSTSFLGLIYVPNGEIDITGSNSTSPTFNTQFVGYNVEMYGNATVDINFNGPQNYQRPASLNLQE